MFSKFKHIYLLIIIILLQSCSGGKIGDFLESSFEVKDDEKQTNNVKIQADANSVNIEDKNSIKDKKLTTNNKVLVNKKTIDNKQINKENEISSNQKKIVVKNDIRQNDSKQIRNFTPQTYRITVILRQADPTSPSENFSKVLRNSNLNFEIEKIERYFDKDVNDKK